MAKKKSGGGFVWNVFNIGFTVFMFALPSLLLGYWYFYLRDPDGGKPQEVVVQQREQPTQNAMRETEPISDEPVKGMIDTNQSIGIFSDTPNSVGTQPPGPTTQEAKPTRDTPHREDRQMRTWSDTTGKFSVVAKFYSASGDKIKLVKENDEKIEVPIAKLSEGDKEYLRQLFKSKGITARF